MGKKLISVLLTVCMVLSLLPTAALAANAALTPAMGAETTQVATYGQLVDALATTSQITLIADITVTAAMTVGRDITINGGGYTLSATVTGTDEWGKTQTGSNYTLLTVNAGKTLTLNNATIKGGGQSALINNGTLRMDGVIITQSGSLAVSGGGLKNNAKAVLTNCAFTRNVASYGGGFVNAGTMIMDRCSVTENRSLNQGGGGCENNGRATLYLNNCTFANNQSNEIGGGINNCGANLYALNTTVVGNISNDSAVKEGGGIGNNSGTVTLVNSIVSNNYAKQSGSFTASDIGEYSTAGVTAYYALVGFYLNSSGNPVTLPGPRNATNTAGVFAGLRDSELLDNNGAPTTATGLGKRPVLVKQTNGTYAAPLSATTTNNGITGGCDVRFAYNPVTATVSVMAYDTTAIPSFSAGADGDKVTEFQNSSTRDTPNVIRGSMNTGENYFTVKVNAPVNCTVTGGSAFGDTYAKGTHITFTALPARGYRFVGWYDSTNTLTALATTASYTHEVNANITITAKVEETANAMRPTITKNLNTNEVTYAQDADATALSVTATVTDGGTLSYAWYSNSSNSTTNGTKIDGKTSAIYTPPTTEIGNKYYYCVVTNTNSNATGTQTATTTSSIAKITVIAKVDAVAPTITKNLNTNEVTYTQGADATALSVTATVADGGTLSYAWYSNSSNSTTNGTKIDGKTTATYTPPTTAIGTKYYYCVVTNTNNSATGTTTAITTSKAAMITVIAKVNAVAPTIAKNLDTSEVSYVQGATATALGISASATDNGTLSYEWYSNSSNSTMGGIKLSGTSASYTPLTATVGTTYYYCVVTNTNNNATGTKTATTTSNIAKIKVSIYTITFNANGGNISPASAATVGDKLTTLPTPTRSRYRFDGWFTAESGGTQVTTSTVFTADTTIYAHWTYAGGSDNDYTPPKKPVVVDGKTQNIGTETRSGGTTVITVDQPKLTEQIGQAKDESNVVVSVSNNTTTIISLTMKNLEDMAKKNMTLSVQTGGITYALPTTSMDVAALAAAFPGQDTAKIPFEVTIKASDIKVEGTTVIVRPVSFTVAAVYGGKSMTVDRFSTFVDRTFEITKAQSTQISTAVVVESDGTLRHVPTYIFQKDGKYYATVKSMTNSVYTLIRNEVTFADAAGKWYEDVANEVGSRKIVMGTDKGTFDGDAQITRAEYATMMVRALGLPQSKSASFTDVAANAWYADYVATASEYGIVKGIGNNKFNPEGLITRQEAMQMIYNASKLTGFPKLLNARNLSAEFGDFATVDKWATEAVSWCLNNNLSVNLKNTVKPSEKITRSEMSAMILRLLQRSELVDIRAKT